MRSRGKRYRRKNRGIWLVAFLLVIAVFFAFGAYAAVRSFKGPAEEAAYMEADASPETDSEENENLQENAAAEEAADLEQSPEAAKEQETETEPTKAEPALLENLSGIPAGSIISAEKFDFEHLDQYFMSWEIEEGDNLYERMNGKSYRPNDYVPLSTLRYVKLPHYNFNGEIQVGELVINVDIQEDIFDIFKELFRNKYQIETMYLIDNYWTGDPDSTDSASIDVNNTSAFCFRQVTGGKKLSNHAYGRAIDINPQQNPYVSYSTGSPRWSHQNANDYIKRDTGLPHVITHDDLAYKLFKEHGFTWGGDWTNPKDYQHFEKK